MQNPNQVRAMANTNPNPPVQNPPVPINPIIRRVIQNFNYVLLLISIAIYIGAIDKSVNHPNFKLFGHKYKVAGIFIALGIYILSFVFVMAWDNEEEYRSNMGNEVHKNRRWCCIRVLTTLLPLGTSFLSLYLKDRDSLTISLLVMFSFMFFLLILKKPEDGGMSEVFVSCIFTILASGAHWKDWSLFIFYTLLRLFIVWVYLECLNWIRGRYGEDATPQHVPCQELLGQFFESLGCFPGGRKATPNSTGNNEAPGTSHQGTPNSTGNNESPGTSHQATMNPTGNNGAPGTSHQGTLNSTDNNESLATSHQASNSTGNNESSGTSHQGTLNSTDDNEALTTNHQATSNLTGNNESSGTSHQGTPNSTGNNEAPATSHQATPNLTGNNDAPTTSHQATPNLTGNNDALTTSHQATPNLTANNDFPATSHQGTQTGNNEAPGTNHQGHQSGEIQLVQQPSNVRGQPQHSNAARDQLPLETQSQVVDNPILNQEQPTDPASQHSNAAGVIPHQVINVDQLAANHLEQVGEGHNNLAMIVNQRDQIHHVQLRAGNGILRVLQDHLLSQHLRQGGFDLEYGYTEVFVGGVVDLEQGLVIAEERFYPMGRGIITFAFGLMNGGGRFTQYCFWYLRL